MNRLVSLSFLVAVLAGCGQSERREAAPEAGIARSAAPDVADGSAAPGGAASPLDASRPAATDAEALDGPPVGAAARDSRSGTASGGASGDTASASQSGAVAILARAERAYDGIRSMEADFVQRVTVPLLDQTRTSRGKIFHRRPDRFLMRFSDPAGDVIVADGTYLWMYYPSTDDGQVLRSRLSAGGGGVDLQREFLSDAARRFSVTHLGVQDVGGRPADVLRLVPREPSQYTRVTLWVDREDSMVRRFETVEHNESVRRLELSGLRPNVSLPDDLFEFTPPPGAEVFDS